MSFVPDYQRVVFHQISLIRDGKLVSAVKTSQIKVVQEETESADFQYNGIKRAFVILKDVRSNDRIDVAYSVIGFNPIYKGKFSSETYFYSNVAVANYFQTIITTKAHPLNFRFFNEAPSPRKFHHDDTLMYFWQDPPLKTPETNNTAPSWYNRYNMVSVTEYNNWKEVSDWGLQLFQNYQVPLSALVKAKIDGFIKEGKGDKTKVAELATRFVQDQIRYQGIETGIYTHQPHDPGQICAQRYGDCKDKAFLLTMMLREAGINAYVALANTNLTNGLIKEEASPEKFNHAIVAIDTGHGYQFIDATISYQRGPLKDLYIPAYGYALILRSETKGLDAIIPGGIKKTSIKEKLFVQYRENGPSMLEVESDYDGGAANNNREMFAGSSLSNLQKSFLRYYTKYYDSIEQEKEIIMKDDPVNNRIHVSESYRLPSFWKTNEKGKEYFSAIAHALIEFFPNPGSTYKQGPLSLSFPLNVHYTLEIHLPDTWSFPKDDYHISNDSYSFDFKVDQKDSIITLEYHLETFKDNIPEERVKTYLEDYKNILQHFEYTLTRNGQTDTPNTSNTSTTTEPAVQRINASGLVVFLLTLAIVVFVFVYCNKLSVETAYLPGMGRKIGGWLVVIGIGLIASVCLQAYQLFSFNYFSLSSWVTLGKFGGAGFQSLILIEEVVNTVQICTYIATLYWFFKKRDIFPRAYVIAIILNMILVVLLAFFYATIPYPSSIGNLNKDSASKFIRIVIYGAIWGTYMIRSERVKATFVEPWKVIVSPNDNFKEVSEDDKNEVENEQEDKSDE